MTTTRVTNDRFRVSSLLTTRLKERDISVSSVLRHSVLPPHFLEQDKIHATTAQLFALWKAIGEVSGDPGIGLQLGAEPRFERFDPPQIAAACSRNFRDALDRIARYKLLTCPEEIRLQSHREETTVVFAFVNDEHAEPDVLVDVCLSWTLAIGQRGTDGQIHPVRLELIRKPRNKKLLEAHYGCPIRFGARRNAIVFRTADLDRPFITHNKDLLRVLDQQVDIELQARQMAQDVGEQVRQALRHSIAGGRPNREEVAKHLHLSLRTLQRRLREAGVTFQQLVQDTRAALARQYLTDRALEMSEVAFLVGYSRPLASSKAAHIGLTPSVAPQPFEGRAKGRRPATSCEPQACPCRPTGRPSGAWFLLVPRRPSQCENPVARRGKAQRFRRAPSSRFLTPPRTPVYLTHFASFPMHLRVFSASFSL